MAEISQFPHRRIKPFDVVSPTEWRDMPVVPVSWLVDGAVPRGTVCLFSGPGSAGKSYLALQLQIASATMNRWCGMYVRPCRSFGLYCEDPVNVIHGRSAAICRHYGVELDALDDMWIKAMDGEDATLWEANRYGSAWQTTPLWSQVCEFTQDAGCELLIIDTVARVFGGNENSRQHVTAFIGELEKWARATNGAVLLNVHPSKSGDPYSGSTAWEATCRAHMHIKRPKGYDPESPGADHLGRVLRTMKANWGNVGGVTKLRWRRGVFAVEDENSAPVPDQD